MGKFTAGIWRHHRGLHRVVSFPSSDPAVGSVVVCSGVSAGDGDLIAAAPSLYEACRGAKAVMDAQGITAEHPIVGFQYRAIVNALNSVEK